MRRPPQATYEPGESVLAVRKHKPRGEKAHFVVIRFEAIGGNLDAKWVNQGPVDVDAAEPKQHTIFSNSYSTFGRYEPAVQAGKREARRRGWRYMAAVKAGAKVRTKAVAALEALGRLG